MLHVRTAVLPPPRRKPLPETWRVEEIRWSFGASAIVLLLLAGAFLVFAYLAWQDVDERAWIAALAAALGAGIALDLRGMYRERRADARRGFVLQFDRQGIRYRQVPLVEWQGVLALDVQDRRIGKSRLPFLLLTLKEAACEAIAPHIRQGFIEQRFGGKVQLDTRKRELAFFIHGLDDSAPDLLEIARRFLERFRSEVRA